MSSISVGSERVIRCCSAYLMYSDWCKCWRAAEILKKEAATKYFFGLFGKPVGYKAAAEDMEKEAEFNSLRHWYYLNSDCLNQSEEIAESLKLLAENGHPVIITSEHAWIFQDWTI